MTTAQHKIGSRFDATSTATEVLAGIDLSGKFALVTGGYSGIGLETTRALTAAGAQVLVPARRPAVARAALAGIPAVEVDELDLADLDSVRTFSERLLATGRGLDIVITNAGLMAAPQTTVGPGWETMFATNHLGHFALVNRLWPAVRPGARIVSVSSRGHFYSGIRWDDLHFEQGYEKWAAYGQSKTANSLLAVHLDALAKEHGIRAFALHPGLIQTPLIRHLSREELRAHPATDEEGNFVGAVKTVEQGAATQVWAATAPRLDGLGGVYLEDCEIAGPAPADGTRAGVRDYAIDPVQAARLWTLSAELTGVNAFA
ncbi:MULTISPECIES: oxidoreductase [unclassified Crossiella]|uniref:oxidoreductase n=1 Tax=unclassified Crossiella TaxID=2620835 RepID=UPI001FFF8114|nr:MULTISPECIES: oxidoreductase [unclassified Crossiella]MCK2238834.1 oxidoreductase [Crossiella sp. S99.2]MCK2251596.1 oxidoreductase [Crossiella sp. S99.1]